MDFERFASPNWLSNAQPNHGYDRIAQSGIKGDSRSFSHDITRATGFPCKTRRLKILAQLIHELGVMYPVLLLNRSVL